MQSTIGDIGRFYLARPDLVGKVKVNGRHGYNQIKAATITAADSEVIRVEFSNGKSIEGSPNHLLMGEYGWVNLNDLAVGDKVLTKFGYTRVVSSQLLKETRDLWDLCVDEQPEFYANEIVSHNSSLTDTICYALYGKPYRDIKLAQLINSINNKDCLVEIEFSVAGVEYKVRRGMKPAVFEIYKNGDLITAEAASRDYQKVLETQILKMNLKTFRQLVVIGSATYTPFMQLKASERREIIEDILDISIFSKMGELSRSTERELKSSVARLKSEVSIREETLVSLNSSMSSLLADMALLEKNKEKELDELKARLNTSQSSLSNFLSGIESLKGKTSSYNDLKTATNQLTRKISSVESELQHRLRAIENAKETHNCPTCYQPYPEAERQKLIDKYSNGLEKFEADLATLVDTNDKLAVKLVSVEADVESLRQIMTEAKVTAETIKNINERISAINNSGSNLSGLAKIQDSIEETTKLVSDLRNSIAEKETELEYYSVISSMLKDSGIKSTIVARYLPIINKLINQYLEQFGLFVGFELSPTFEETIKARHRDTYSYNSFSEGEKAKIDSAILMTWRHIASIKSTMNCNLLFLDEVGGQSLDFDSHEQMIRMISESAQNVFLITHRETEEEFFDRIWEFSKPKNYTTMTERLK